MKRFLRFLGHVLVLLILIGACWLFYQQVREHPFERYREEFLKIPMWGFAAAAALTVLNYLILICYDWFAVRWIGQKDMPLRKIALVSFTAYAFSYNFGATLFGTSVRYRLYSAYGMPLLKIVELLVILGLTFWFGLFALAGVVFIVAPLPMPPELAEVLAKWHLSFSNTYWFGVVLLAIAVGYALLTGLLQSPHFLGFFRSFRRWRIPLPPIPPLKLTLYQIAIACADLMVAAAVLYVLAPTAGEGYLHVLGVFMLAFTAGVLTHVPGGYGVFELIVVNFTAKEHKAAVLAAIFAFRLIYYWLPLALAAVMLSINELVINRQTPSSSKASGEARA